MAFPYREGDLRIDAQGTKLADLPGGTLNHHWTKNVVANPDGRTLYVPVGDTAAAMQQLERAYAEHSGWIVFLRSQRAWDSMRSDPRFRSLLRKVSLDSWRLTADN